MVRNKLFWKNWIGFDFHGTQLRVIYQLFNDQIVDKYKYLGG